MTLTKFRGIFLGFSLLFSPITYSATVATYDPVTLNAVIPNLITFGLGEEVYAPNVTLNKNQETGFWKYSGPTSAAGLSTVFSTTDTSKNSTINIFTGAIHVPEICNVNTLDNCYEVTFYLNGSFSEGFYSLDPNIKPVEASQASIYQKLDSNGNILPADTPYWSCFKDTTTGLVWEVKTSHYDSDGIPYNGLHDTKHTYTWFNSTGINDGGDPGAENGGTCYDSFNCDTEKFVAQVNQENFCGSSNWRLPTILELESISGYETPVLFKFDGNDPVMTDWTENAASQQWSSTNAKTQLGPYEAGVERAQISYQAHAFFRATYIGIDPLEISGQDKSTPWGGIRVVRTD